MKTIFLSCSVFLSIGVTVFASGNKAIDPELKNRASSYIKNKAVQFTENRGQMTDMDGKAVPYVLFKVDAPGLNLYITEKGITYCFFESGKEEENGHKSETSRFENKKKEVKWSRIDMDLKNASIQKGNIITEGKSEYFNQYFLGHCPNGILNVYSYSKITIKEIYPHIDWVLYNAENKGFKYDFIVHPGADPSQIKLVYRSQNKLTIDKNGNVGIRTPVGTLTENAPISYLAESKTPVVSSFIKKSVNNYSDIGYETQIVFNLQLDSDSGHLRLQSETLIIDPQLVWCTEYGGSNADGFTAFDCDLAGNLFITGYTYTNPPGFPVLNAGTFFQGVAIGIYTEAILLKFSSVGALIWSTYYGGAKDDTGYMIKIDLSGNVFVTGNSTSTDFPVQNAATYFQALNAAGSDAFILKFDNAGTRLWATYYGGSSDDVAQGIDIDAFGNVFVVGFTKSTNFPTKNSGTYYKPGLAGRNIFILEFDNSGNLLWGTVYPGNAMIFSGFSLNSCAITIDNSNNLFVAGNVTSSLETFNSGTFFQGVYAGGSFDLFILKFDNLGNRLWATYYGGSSDEGVNGIATDGSNIFITGTTKSVDFPVQNNSCSYYDSVHNGWTDGYILKFDNSGNRLWGTYFGGSNDEDITFYGGINHGATNTGSNDFDRIAVDVCGNVYVTFETNSTDIITLNPGCSSFFKGTITGTQDNIIVCFNSNGVLSWSSYLGGGYFRGPLSISPVDGKTLFWGGETWGGLPYKNPGGGAYFNNTWKGSDDSYIAKFIPSIETFSQSQVNSTSCTPCNGNATINLSCGNGPYSYLWSNGTSTISGCNANNTITGLCAGTYTVTATSSCNQTQTASYTITGLTCGGCTLIGQFTKGTANCTSCGCKEWIMVNVTGGVSPYTYIWPDGYANRYKNQLCPGDYVINIKDKNGCSINFNLTTP